MFKGVYVPVITPFLSDGTLDLSSLSKLCENFIEQGVRGIVPLGTTGEASALNTSERHDVVATVAKMVSGTNVELIVGAGTNSTATTLERMDEFAEFSPKAYLIVTPYYIRPSEEGIIAHFMACADKGAQVNSDIMLYNIPARTGRYVSTNALLKCSEHERISGVKQAVGSLDDETLTLIANTNDSFSILAGDDYLACPITLLGGKGAVSASAHVATSSWVKMIEAAENNDVDTALSNHNKLLPLVKAGFAEPNPSCFKGVLASMGTISSDYVRLPLMSASKESVANFQTLVESI